MYFRFWTIYIITIKLSVIRKHFSTWYNWCFRCVIRNTIWRLDYIKSLKQWNTFIQRENKNRERQRYRDRERERESKGKEKKEGKKGKNERKGNWENDTELCCYLSNHQNQTSLANELDSDINTSCFTCKQYWCQVPVFCWQLSVVCCFFIFLIW